MRRLRATVWLVLAMGAGSAAAQAVDAKVCDVVNHPKDFDGKTVRVTGVVQADFDTFLMRGETCSSVLWLSWPAGTKARSGPATVVTMQLAANAAATPASPARAALTLDAGKDFQTFDLLLSQRPKTPGMCLACPKNDVTATLTGRIDGTDSPGVTKDASGKVTGLDGFGNMNMYGAQLVITGVANVAAKEIDYSKAPRVDGDNQGGGGKDYLGLTKKSEAAFPAGTPAVAEIEAAIAAFGAPGQDNGVTVAFGEVGNVPEGEGVKSSRSAPEGLLFTVRVDGDRLKGDALSRAMAHQGAEIVALREHPVDGMRNVETRAWQVVLDVVLGSRQKSITLPGGVVLWSEGWPAAERNADATNGLRGYVEDREEMSR